MKGHQHRSLVNTILGFILCSTDKVMYKKGYIYIYLKKKKDWKDEYQILDNCFHLEKVMRL